MRGLIDAIEQVDWNNPSDSFLQFFNDESTAKIFYDIYSTPDKRCTDIMKDHNCTLDELTTAFKSIKNSSLLQDMFLYHPIQRNFIHKIKSFVQEYDHIENMLQC
jgi:hypothetical protein